LSIGIGKVFALMSLSLGLFAGSALAQEKAPLTPEVAELTAKYNDDEIAFNDQMTTLGKADAPVTAVLVYGLSEDASWFVNRILPGILSKFVETGKLKLVVMEFPLTWHDMQALAAFRCVPKEKHWDVLKETVRYGATAFRMKREGIANAPDHIWPMVKDFGVSREKADKCMRNNAIAGFVEAQRQIVLDTWKTNVAPVFIVGDKVLATPSSGGIVEDAIELALKGAK
jgi:protein-disulfide isomerase